MMTISEMMGVPEDERETVRHKADELVGWNDPDVLAGRDPLEMNFHGVLELTAVALEMADRRAEDPGDDLMSALVHTEVDGERLLPEEIGAFFVLLSVAGNDTTRHTTSHALRALTDFPDQRALLMEDLSERMPGAVEEFVRWATPVMTFRRTATSDAEIHGQAIAKGDKVALLYTSANRDEEAFDEPGRFDVMREPNRHVGFGGGGPPLLPRRLPGPHPAALHLHRAPHPPARHRGGRARAARGQLHKRHQADAVPVYAGGVNTSHFAA